MPSTHRRVSGAAIGLGAGGHARVVVDALRLSGVQIVGLLDPRPELKGTSIDGVAVLGDDALLPALRAQGVDHAFIAVGGVHGTQARRRLYLSVLAHGFDPIQVTHPTAVVARSATIGRGATLLAGAIVNAGAVLGDNVLINTGAIVEHDCRIADHVHVATGARLASTVTVGEGTHVGIGSTIRQCLRIGANTVVGAGAVVVSDVPDNVVVVGVPARILRERAPEDKE